MATLSGKKGLVEYDGGQVASFRNWSLDVDTNMLDHTVWSTGTDQWRSFTDGLSGWSGSFGDLFDAASTGQDDLRTNLLTPASATVKLYLDKDGGEHFTGSAYISSASYGAEIDGDVTASYNIQGTGTLTYSTTT